MKPSRATVIGMLWWLLVLPAAVWAVIRLLGVERGPLVQLLAFTPYVAAWAVLPLVLSLALRRWWVAGVAALVVLALAWAVLPRLVGSGRPATAQESWGRTHLRGTPAPAALELWSWGRAHLRQKPAPAALAEGAGSGAVVRLLTANLLFGGADPAALVKLIRDRQVDVLTLQEFTPEAEAGLDRAGIAALLPYREAHPAEGAGGSAVYARFPLSGGGLRINHGGMTQAYTTVAVAGSRPLLVESAHPHAPDTIAHVPFWRADLAAEPGAPDPPATPDGPVRILAGDFNSTLDHSALRRLVGKGYRDAAATVGAGLVGTWGPYDGDLIPPVTIDHVLVDRRVGVRRVTVHPLRGSDHRAVLAELALPGG